MEKMKKKNSKLISIILTVLIVFNTVFVPFSHAAGILNQTLSVIRNPLAWVLIEITDDVNRILAAVFAVDTKWEGLKNDASDAWDSIKNDSDGVLSGILHLAEDVQEAWYNLMLSPDDVFSGNVQIANANIFSDTFDENGKFEASDLNTFNHLIKQVKQGVAGLYYTMRNLAGVILLILLIYCGIRMVLSSSAAGERAKWKMYLIEWLKALALVMFIHYALIGIFYIADVITAGLRDTLNNGNTLVTEIRKGISDTFALDSTRTLGICNYVFICIIFNYSILNCIFQKVCIYYGFNHNSTINVSSICIW